MEHTSEFAYILGVFMGDGCVTNQHGKRVLFKLNTIDADFADAVQQAIMTMQPKNNIRCYCYQPKERFKTQQPCYQLSISFKELCDVLITDTNNKTIIPQYVFQWEEELQKQFVVGLMDSEGYVAQKKTIPSDCNTLTDRSFFMGFKVTDPWALDFAKLLNRMGIRTGKIRYEKPYGISKKTPIHFSIKMTDWVKQKMWFNIQRKQQRVDIWSSTEPYTQRTRNPRRSSPTTTRQTLSV